ncbi:16S rRNA (adenine(1518)-N(6)/adenine(1519)-N(6))-dimethyltransferaseRsmA [soil metagenome]
MRKTSSKFTKPPKPALPFEAPPRTDIPDQRQTLSFLKKLFSAYGLEAKTKLGQNFLIDLNLIDLIGRAGELTPHDAVLEVGTGTGSLTARLAKEAGRVVTIEIDGGLQPIAEQLVGSRPNVLYMKGDCLAKKSVLNPDMIDAWLAAAKQLNDPKLKLVANLPYVIATPLISNLLASELPIERMVVMVQWEIAERLRAVVGTKDYNALSVITQSVADVEVIRKVLPTNFHPMPKVDSAIVMIKPNAAKRKVVGDVTKFREFVRDLYIHRRKNLRVALAGSPRVKRVKSEVDAKLKEIGIDGNARAESLDIPAHLKLCEAFG